MECGRRIRAGGGIRTPKLLRARAPKARAFPSFATPARPVDCRSGPRPGAVGKSNLCSRPEAAIRSQSEYEAVLALVAAGHTDSAVSRRTGVPRSTIREWRVGSGRQLLRPGAARCSHDFETLPARPYAYLLGVYLGDGCLSLCPREVWRLRLCMDARYPEILGECCQSMEAVMPGKRARRYARPGTSYIEISMYSKHWLCYFPQHGPGRKHLRKIVLEQWQERMVRSARESFLRGLIHSDGCRIVANDRGVPSPRYHFSNLSEDIKGMFCESLDALDIPWTRPCDRQIAIYRRSAVASLDQFIGPKR